MLEGSGGKIAVLTGADGKLLVDAGIAVVKPRKHPWPAVQRDWMKLVRLQREREELLFPSPLMGEGGADFGPLTRIAS